MQKSTAIILIAIVSAMLTASNAAAMRDRPIPEAKGVQAVMNSGKTSKSKVTLAKDVMDRSLIEEIDRTGYIAKLYGK